MSGTEFRSSADLETGSQTEFPVAAPDVALVILTDSFLFFCGGSDPSGGISTKSVIKLSILWFVVTRSSCNVSFNFCILFVPP